MSVVAKPDYVFAKQSYLLPEHQGHRIGRARMLDVMR